MFFHYNALMVFCPSHSGWPVCTKITSLMWMFEPYPLSFTLQLFFFLFFFLTSHFRCLELCVCKGWLTKWSLCKLEACCCLFGVTNERCCTMEYHALILMFLRNPLSAVGLCMHILLRHTDSDSYSYSQNYTHTCSYVL